LGDFWKKKLLASLPKISYPIEGKASRTDVVFLFMPGADSGIYTKVGSSGTLLN
jgi:hypothetical protein